MTNILYPVPTGASSLFVHVLEAADVVHRMSTIQTEQVTLDALVSLDEITVGSRNRWQWTGVMNFHVYEHLLADFMRDASQCPSTRNSYISREHPHLAPEILDQVVR
jgi:hypothetical protein